MQGLVEYTVPTEALQTALLKAGVQFGTPVTELETRERDLCEAWLYVWCSMLPSARNNSEDSDSGWKHTEAGFQVNKEDKARFRTMANVIFNKYGLPEYQQTSLVRIFNL